MYDPLFTFQITVNGQLLLSMLYEMISTRLPGSIAIMQNTDGLEFKIRKEHYEEFEKICREWEKITSLELETLRYSKMIVSDVNSYIAVYEDVTKSPKCKGRFEFEELPLHKNKSFIVVTKALYEYFINGVSPEDYLKTNKNIYDYCAASKIKGNWRFHKLMTHKGSYIDLPLQKLVRYYASNRGCKLVKRNLDDLRETQLVAGKTLLTLFNLYQEKPFEEYDIDTRFYLEQIHKEIDKIESGSTTSPFGQLSLF